MELTSNNQPIASVREWLRQLDIRQQNYDPYKLYWLYSHDYRVLDKVPYENFALILNNGLQ